MGYTKTIRKLTLEEKQKLSFLEEKAIAFLNVLIQNNVSTEEVKYVTDYILKISEENFILKKRE